VRDESHREAALITFLVTLSGVMLVGIGSAFWGVVAGAIALGVQQLGRKPFAGKDIAAACKIKLDQRAADEAAPSSSTNVSTPRAGKTS